MLFRIHVGIVVLYSHLAGDDKSFDVGTVAPT